MDVSSFGNILLPLTEKIISCILQTSGTHLPYNDKGEGQLQTELDLNLEILICDFLNRHFPDDAIISEESNPGGIFVGRNAWIVDPLDGTQNCAMGMPMFGVALVRVEHNCPTLGAIFLPAKKFMGESGLFVAAKGQGAWQYNPGRESVKLQCSAQTDITRASLLVEGPSKQALTHPAVQKLIQATQRTRVNLSAVWSTFLATSGKQQTKGADILVAVHNKPWDNLPMCLFMEEAGGMVTDLKGNSWSLENCANIICCNNSLHKQALLEIK